MNTVLGRLRRVFTSKEGLFLGIFFVFIFFIYLTNTLHESYPDEFDNILGGWYMLHGKPLYTGFFTHHNPLAYVLSAVIELFSWQSFVRLRLIYAVLLFAYTVWSYVYLRKRFAGRDLHFYLFFIFLFAIGATYFWGHMLLADNLAAFFLLPIFALLFLASIFRERLTYKDMVMVSILGSLALLSSLTFLYLVSIVYAFSLYLYIRDNRIKPVSLPVLKILFVIGVPYLIFAAYLLATGSLKDYWYQNIVFNQTFYIYNYPRPEGAAVNPIRYAIVMAQNFHNNFSSLLISAKDFNFSFPFNIALAVGNVGLLIYLLFRKQYLLAVVMLLFITYANARTNPLTSSEKDYQSSVYILLSFFNASFLLQYLYRELNEHMPYTKKMILSFVILLVGVYVFFNTAFLLRKYTEKTYLKFMGLQPLIYDRPQIGPILNTLVEEEDYVWVGPFEFGELFYTRGKVPSKYIILLPEFAKSPTIQGEMISNFDDHKPKVIYFDKRYSIRGYMPEKFGQFFLDFCTAYNRKNGY